MAKEAFTFKCSTCGAMLAGKREWTGRKVRCNKCNAVMTVPEPSEAAAARTAASAADTTVAKTVRAARDEGTEAAPPARPGPFDELAADFPTLVRWTGEGVVAGARNFVPLLLAVLIGGVLFIEAIVLGPVAWALVLPAVTAGFVLIMLDVARGRKASVGRLFAGFVDGRYWRSVGVFWLFAAIYAAGAMPAVFLVVLFQEIAPLSGPAGPALAVILSIVVFLALIYLLSRVFWAFPLVLDRRTPVVKSFQESWQMTGRVGGGMGLFVLTVMLWLIGLVPFALSAAIAYGAFSLTHRMLTVSQAGLEAAALQNLDSLESVAAFPPEAAAALVCAFVMFLLWGTVKAILSVPIFVGYRESVPH